MKRLIIICVVSLLMTLAAASIAKANSTAYDWSVAFDLQYMGDPEVYFVGPLSYSSAYVENDIGDGDDGYDEAFDTDTYAYAEIGSAYAEAETGDGWVWAEVYSEPPPGVVAWAGGDAYQDWLFYTEDEGTVYFEVDYEIYQELFTENYGDWAYAEDEVGISLYDDNWYEINSNSAPLINYVENGDSGVWGDSGTLSVTGEFWPAGAEGYIGIWARPYVEAYTEDTEYIIPAPGAIILSGIGVSLVGWLRRRKTL